jgi:Domain of unknown function (DUF5916)
MLSAAVEVGWSAPASQSPVAVQGSAAAEQASASLQPNPAGQNSQSAPQNPSPPLGANAPGQMPPPSEQNPPPSAQLPEPATKDPEVQLAPKPPVTPPSLTIPRLTRAPALENFLGMKPEGEAALQMAKVTGFMQRNPHDGEQVSEKTEAYLGYDQKNLYVVFVCFDDPKKVRARMSAREDVYDDDQVAVLFDTFHDRRRAYEFQTTPLGVQWDAIFTDAATSGLANGNWDTSWDTVWDSRGKLTSRGFVAWMSIPFKSLRFPARQQQEWGILLYRGITRKDEDAYWPQVSLKEQGRLGREATLHGLEGISPDRDIELIPYGIMRGFRSLDERDPYNPFFQNAEAQGQFGLDAKFVIKDHFVLDLTANPDFSQVESDQPQIVVNQRFEVYFPEKRPFFLENADFFRTPINLFYTRNVQDPSAGIRLTGKDGPYSVGLMASDDRAPGLAVPSFCPPTSPVCSDSLYGDRSYFTIARVSRDIFRQSSVGAIYTDWQCPATGEYNRVGGVDTNLKFSPNWTLQGQAVTSSSNLAGLNAYLSPTGNLQTTCEDNLFQFSSGNFGNGNHYGGPADELDVRRNGLHFNYNGSYLDVSPGFVSMPGFVNRADIRQVNNLVYYRFRPKKGWLLAWGPTFRQHYTFDHEGNRLDTYYDAYLRVSGGGQTDFWFSPYIEQRERLRPQDFAFEGLSVDRNFDYHEHQSYVRAETKYLRKVTLGAEYTWGDKGNFEPSTTANPQFLLSRLNTGDASLSFRPVKPLKIENTYLYQRLRATNSEYLSALAQAPPGSAIGRGISNNHIVRSEWNWQFTPQFALRAIFQYNSLLANTPGNTYYPYTSLPTSKQFNADLLFTYLVHPGTAIYVGYNSDLQNLDVVPYAGVFNTAKGYINDSRQFFVKVSYQFRF